MPFFGTVIVVEKKDKIDWAGWSNGALPSAPPPLRYKHR